MKDFTWTETGALRQQEMLKTEQVLEFYARDVRKERTGTHAFVAVLLDGYDLAHSTFNIERHEDRVRIMNSAYKRMNAVTQKAKPAEEFRSDFDTFCLELWGEWIGRHLGEEIEGDQDPAPIAFFMPPYLLEDGSTIMFGPPGFGKSYIAMLMAVHLMAGLRQLWDATAPRRPLYINLERGRKSMSRRLGLVNKALGLPTTAMLPMINRRGSSLMDILDAVKETVARLHIDYIFLDSISRIGAGDLNENAPVNKAMDALNSLDIPWFAIAHTPRSDDSHIFGSQMFDAAADLLIRLTSHSEKDSNVVGVSLEGTKANDIKPPPAAFYALSFNDVGLVGARKAKESEFPTLTGQIKQSLREQVIQHLLLVGADSASHIATELGLSRTQISSLLAHDPAFVKVGNKGKSIEYGLKREN